MAQKRIDILVDQLNDVARQQVEFMSFFPPLADQITLGLGVYLGEKDSVKLSNNDDDFSFDDNYGHDGLGVEGGQFRIPLMVRVRDHASCQQPEGIAVSPESQSKTAEIKSVDAKADKLKTGKKSKKKKAKKLKAKKIKKSGKLGKKKASLQMALKEDSQHNDEDCNETFLRFKLLCERRDEKLVIDIAGTQTIEVDPEHFEPLYEAIFVYLKAYFSPEKFFDKQSESYQNASYGFFRKQF